MCVIHSVRITDTPNLVCVHVFSITLLSLDDQQNSKPSPDLWHSSGSVV